MPEELEYCISCSGSYPLCSTRLWSAMIRVNMVTQPFTLYPWIFHSHKQLTNTSLPSLPHPFLSQTSPHSHRAYSATASPPASPKVNPSHHNHHHGFHNHYQPPLSTYQALASGTSSQTNYQSTYSKGMESRSAGPIPQISRERDGPPMLFGIELKWIS
jgi:hypothetical protein